MRFLVAIKQDSVDDRDLERWFAGDVTVTLISARNDGNSLTQARGGNSNLMQDLADLGIEEGQIHRTRGKWQHEDGKMHPEPSLAVEGLPFDAALALSKKYKQEAFIFKGADGVVAMYQGYLKPGAKTEARIPTKDGQPLSGMSAIRSAPRLPKEKRRGPPNPNDLWVGTRSKSFEIPFDFADDSSVKSWDGESPLTQAHLDDHGKATGQHGREIDDGGLRTAQKGRGRAGRTDASKAGRKAGAGRLQVAEATEVETSRADTQVRIKLGRRSFSCRVASTHADQVIGLSRTASLSDTEGLLFFFAEPQDVTMHQGGVAYPLDMIGIDVNHVVTKIVAGTVPKSTKKFNFSRVAYLLEVVAGSGVKVGDKLTGDERFDRGLHDREDEDGDDKTITRRTPDVVEQESTHMYDEPMAEYYHQLYPDALADQLLEPDIADPVFKRGQRGKCAQIVDEAKFVEKVADILFAHVDQIKWGPDHLNGGVTERAVVTRELLAQWLGRATTEASRYVLEAAADARGLNLIGDAFLLSGMAETVQVGGNGPAPILVLRRRSL